MPYEIDSNIVFNAHKRSGRKSKINEMPFDKIAIGESFHVAQEGKEAANRLSGYCQIAGKRLNKRFAMRSVDASDPRGPGVRIWRVEDKGSDLSTLFAAKGGAAPAVAKAKAQKVVARKPQPHTPTQDRDRKAKQSKVAKAPEPTPSRRQRRQAEGRSFSAHG